MDMVLTTLLLLGEVVHQLSSQSQQGHSLALLPCFRDPLGDSLRFRLGVTIIGRGRPSLEFYRI